MKYITSLALLCCLSTGNAFTQKTEAFPCCGIAGIDAKKGIVTVINNETGRVQQFKPAARDIGSLRTGDKIALQNGKITSVNGVGKIFQPFEPVNEFEPVNGFTSQVNDGVPCCSIVSLQVNDAVPCCGIVTVKNITTGQMHTFQASAAIAKTFTLGQRVNINNNLAVMQSGAGATPAQKGVYAFNIKDSAAIASNKISGVNDTEKWVITPNPALKGAMGRITIRTPEKSTYSLTVFKAGTDEKSAYRYGGTEFLLLPGQYDTRWWDNSKWRLSGVPVRRGMDTRIRAGMLNLNLSGTEWVIYDETKTIVMEQGYSVWRVGLPVGKYYVKVNNDFAEVVIKDGEVTEF